MSEIDSKSVGPIPTCDGISTRYIESRICRLGASTRVCESRISADMGRH